MFPSPRRIPMIAAPDIFLRLAVWLLLAPLLPGIINKVKAWVAVCASGRFPRLLIPEVIPVTVLARFNQSAQMPQARRRPGLAAAFEPALPLQAGRLHRAGTDRPAAVRHRPIVQPRRVA